MENNDKKIIGDVIKRKDALKKEKNDSHDTFLPTGMRRNLGKSLFTRVAKTPEMKKQEKLLNLYNEFFKDKKANSVDLKKMERNSAILEFLYSYMIFIVVIVGTVLVEKLGTHINVNTISEFGYLFFENIELFKIDLISLISSFTGVISVSVLSDKMKKRIQIYKDNNVFNINCYERKQLLEYIKEYISITKVMTTNKELLAQTSEHD